MTEPTRDALHAETLAWLAECERTSRILANSTGDLYGPAQHAKETRIIAHAAACVKRVPELEAEVERLRAKAEIVDAMERGEIHVARGAGQWAIYHTRLAKKFRAPTLLAAYTAATREGTDA